MKPSGAISRVAVLWNPRNEIARANVGAVTTQGKALGVQLEPIEVDIERLDATFATAANSGVRALITMADAFLWSQRERVAALANQYRLAAMYPETDFVEAGGLMGYGPKVRENFRRAAGYVDKILKGTKPGELPVEQPATFDFLINLKTARALGLTIAPAVILRADRVIK